MCVKSGTSLNRGSLNRGFTVAGIKSGLFWEDTGLNARADGKFYCVTTVGKNRKQVVKMNNNIILQLFIKLERKYYILRICNLSVLGFSFKNVVVRISGEITLQSTKKFFISLSKIVSVHL